MSTEIYMVEKSGRRYVGELINASIHLIELQNAYELMRVQTMGASGPQMSHGFVPIGIEGAQNWTIVNPDGFRAVTTSDSVSRGYQSARAQDSGITLAQVMPRNMG